MLPLVESGTASASSAGRNPRVRKKAGKNEPLKLEERA
jgi:hypothetical protein